MVCATQDDIKAMRVICRHVLSLLSILIVVASQLVSRAVVDGLYSMGVWVPRSDLHFLLVRTFADFALVAILISVLAIRMERPKTFGYVALAVACINIMDATV